MPILYLFVYIDFIPYLFHYLLHQVRHFVFLELGTVGDKSITIRTSLPFWPLGDRLRRSLEKYKIVIKIGLYLRFTTVY